MESGYMLNKSFQSRFQTYRNVAQLIPTGVGTRVNFDTIQFDPLNEYDEAILYQFMPQEAGFYKLSSQIRLGVMPAGTVYSVVLVVNGVILQTDIRVQIAGTNAFAYVSRLWYLIPTDFAWVQIFHLAGIGINLTPNNSNTWFEGYRIG